MSEIRNTGSIQIPPEAQLSVSAPHREAAFAAAREIIDRIKAEAPIWKREEGEWVQGTSPPTG